MSTSASTSSSTAHQIQAAQHTASIYRRLTWQGSIPLEITLADVGGSGGRQGAGAGGLGGEGGDGYGGLMGGSGGAMEKYFIQVPRHTYLPLLIPEIKSNFVELAIHEQDLAEISPREEDWWFEYGVSADEERRNRDRDQGPGREDEEVLQGGQDDIGEGRTTRGTGEAVRWHWSLDLIHLHSLIRSPRYRSSQRSTSTSTDSESDITRPLRLILHLSPPTPNNKPLPGSVPLGSNSIDTCRSLFVHQLKEADFVRWGNTRRITGLRRLDLEAGWNSIAEGDFELQSRFANKILPLPIAPSILPTSNSPNPSSSAPQSGDSSLPSRPSSVDPSSSGASSAGLGSSSNRPESVYAMRAIPIKIYLPDDVPVVQDVVPPLAPDGSPNTLIRVLQSSLPLLFPGPDHPRFKGGHSDADAKYEPYALAIPVLAGVEIPPQAEVAWLSSCVAAPDGWLRIGIQLVA